MRNAEAKNRLRILLIACHPDAVILEDRVVLVCRYTLARLVVKSW